MTFGCSFGYSIDMADHEVYPNAPLRLVTAEYRFPHSPALAEPHVDARLAKRLDSRLPIIEPLEQPRDQSVAERVGFRFLSRNRTFAVTVQPNRLAIETTDYHTWEEFRDKKIQYLLSTICNDIGKVSGIERIGLRYINEIRTIDNINQPEDWQSWINKDLLTPIKVASPTGKSMILGQLGITTAENNAIHLWFGIGDGNVIEEGVFKLPNGTGKGPFFLLDIDSFWFNQGILDKFDLDNTISISNKLHSPINNLFEKCITEQLRTKVLRRK